jgi:hypothetical protein
MARLGAGSALVATVSALAMPVAASAAANATIAGLDVYMDDSSRGDGCIWKASLPRAFRPIDCCDASNRPDQ